MPGSDIEHNYIGVVEQSFVMRLGEHMSFMLTGMRIIDHPFMLFLLGTDILCDGMRAPSWNYTGLKIETAESDTVMGSVSFNNGTKSETIPLAKLA